ncbi:MAG: prephenate dehydrogenase [Clostridia bacterium]
MQKEIKSVTVVGLGVIGGSFAIALSKLNYKVWGVDCNVETLQKAKNARAICDGDTVPDKFFPQSDMIIMCLYPAQIADYIARYRDFFPSDCIVIDVAGLKSHFIDKIENVLPQNVEFVFCHPMAGREKKGFDFADARVFLNANFIITPTARTSRTAIEKVIFLAKEIGFGNIKEINAIAHDEIIAFTSQLPHAIAVALINSDKNFKETGGFVGDSYRDLTRIANINGELWTELFLNNKSNLLGKIKEFEKELDIIKMALQNDDKTVLLEKFAQSTERRNNLDNR